MKKTNNKGFSLVELIVVIAIMAVLMVVVAPQMLRYVERTRIQRDNTAISEIANAVKIAMADENVNTNTATNTKVEAKKNATTGVVEFTFDASTALGKELTAVFGTTVKLNSNTYTAAAAYPTLTITKPSGNVTITGTNLLDQDGSKYGDDTNGGSLVY